MDSIPDLLCNEDESFLDDPSNEKDGANFLLDSCSVSDSDCEYIEGLIAKEPLYRPGSLYGKGSWLERVRWDVVKWILETRALFGYQYRTAYLSVIYFDRFFSRRSIDDGKLWVVRVLSVACLSLAAKMEESRARPLSEYHIYEYNFEGYVIKRMELLVLSTLEWSMLYSTPFSYLDYFATKFIEVEELRHKEVIIETHEFILTVLQDVNVVEYRPSIVAAATILAAYGCRLTESMLETRMNAIPTWESVDKEHMFSCYTRLQAIVAQSKPQESTISPIGGAKRRLTCDDGKQDPHRDKIPKP